MKVKREFIQRNFIILSVCRLLFSAHWCNVPGMVEWDVTAMLLDGTELSGMTPTLSAKNPATVKV
jgi:hypothetical protein